MNSTDKFTISVEDLQQTLEPMIRKIIREELTKLSQNNKNIFHLSPEMPLYDDLKEIAQRKVSKNTKLYSHDEVWNE